MAQLAAPGRVKSSGIESVLMQLDGGTPGGQNGHVGHEVRVRVYCAALGFEQETLADTVARPVSCAITAPDVPQAPTKLLDEFRRSTSAKL